MADFLFDKARESFLKGEFIIGSDTLKACLVTSAYTANQSTHQFLSDLTGIVATSPSLSSFTTTAGVLDAADLTFTSVTGSTVTQMVLYKDTGVAGTSRLIAKIDSYSGLPLTPNGGNVNLAWPNDSNRIFKL
jgi:hypothetical protein